MDIIQEPDAIRAWVRIQKKLGLRVSLVPTMGALHRAHMSLVDVAREHSDKVVLYIFVNPTQFNDPKDLEAYPRTLDDDLEKCRNAGVDTVFAPRASDIYPPGVRAGEMSAVSHVKAGSCSLGFEGDGRPGHFDGVTTVLNIMFNITEPDVAVFGEKDYQQLQVVRQMVSNLQMPVEVVGAPLVRDDDGVALSSRNVLLSEEARAAARLLSQSLFEVRDAVGKGNCAVPELESIVRSRLETSSLIEPAYASIVDAETLEPVERIDRPCQFLLTAIVGGVRLLDNIRLDPPTN